MYAKIAVLAIAIASNPLGLPSVAAQSSLNEDLRDLVHAVITNGNLRAYLQDSRFAVLGFRDSITDQGCTALSRGLADRIQAELDRISGVIANVVDTSFRLVERQSLLALEDECALANPENCPRVGQLLAPSDILITGSWSHYNEQHFILTLKALRMGELRSTELLATRRADIAKVGLTDDERQCLHNVHSEEVEEVEPALPPIEGMYHGQLILNSHYADQIILNGYQGPRDFYFALEIDPNSDPTNNTISGLARVAINEDDTTFDYHISGTYTEAGLVWQGTSFVERDADSNAWCMVQAHMTLNRDNPKQLSGRWQANPDVAGGCQEGEGEIILRRQ